jgi:hypothetical protein
MFALVSFVVFIVFVELITKKYVAWQCYRPSKLLHCIADCTMQMFSSIGEGIAFLFGCHYYLWKYLETLYTVLKKIGKHALVYIEAGLLKLCRVLEMIWNKCVTIIDFILRHVLRLHLLVKEILVAIADLLIPLFHLCISPLAILKGYFTYYIKVQYGFCIYFGTLVFATFMYYLVWYDPLYYPDLFAFLMTFTLLAFFASMIIIAMLILPLDTLFRFMDPKYKTLFENHVY